MKRALSIILAACLCLAVLSGCSSKQKNDENFEEKKLAPTEKVDIEKLLPYDEFVGTFKNDNYTMTVVMDENDEMTFTVTTAIIDSKNYEWTFKGFFSDENYRVNYRDGIKYEITYDKNNTEKSRDIVYDYDTGRIQFSDTDSLTWENNAETLDGGNEFTRTE